MAGQGGDKDREDLSEEASQYRLEEFRKQGRVAQSRELTGMIALVASGVTLYALAPSLGTEIINYMHEVMRVDLTAKMNFQDHAILSQTLMRAARIVGAIGLPVAIAGLLIGVGASFAQVGSIFSTDPLTPDFDRINPLAGFKRYFSKKYAFDMVRMIIRAAAVGVVAFFIIKSRVIESSTLLGADAVNTIGIYGVFGKGLFLNLCGLLIVFAAGDFWLQRWEFGKSVRLTKQEAKEEHKEHEGDPLIKSRIKTIQRDVARKRMMEAVKKADVIITNPTHIAIALRYDKEDMAAPRVVAKGADFLAQKIKKIASDAGIPLVENVPLARTLFKSVKVGHTIPRALYQAVAEILAYVYRLKSGKIGESPRN